MSKYIHKSHNASVLVYHLVCPTKYRRAISVPTYSPKQIVQIIKSLTAKKMFEWRPELRKQLWGSQFWTDGYYVSSVGQQGNETTIATYVRNQGTDKTYKEILKQQLTLF